MKQEQVTAENLTDEQCNDACSLGDMEYVNMAHRCCGCHREFARLAGFNRHVAAARRRKGGWAAIIARRGGGGK